MDFVTLKTGDQMPALGFGTWQITGPACTELVAAALRTGYRHIDTAQIYENEAEVGAGITAAGTPRNEIFLTTKLWMTNLTREAAAASFAESLAKLGTDYVDLLLIHWPNPSVPLAETLDAMRRLADTGKVRNIGLSNFTSALIEEAMTIAGPQIAVNQVEYHPFLAQTKLLATMRDNAIALTAYSPLARGRAVDNPTLGALADRYGKTPGQIVLRWLVQQEMVTAIPKTATVARLQENLSIFDFRLSEDDMDAIAALDDNMRTINPGWAPDWD